jgi:Zn-dependent protease
MSVDVVQILFEIIAFLFAISVHESAHAWMANRCGDPTARMLGRITLNPIKHIDPIGTIVMPVLAYISHFPMIGWAKPTPVDPRHFRNPVRDDILTSLAGPVSNLIVASGAVVGLSIIILSSPLGRSLVQGNFGYESSSVLVPVTLLLKEFLFINVLLAAFNVIPVPPLDGSHVLRHFLPEGARRAYDMMGMFGLLLLFVVGGPIIRFLMAPILNFFGSVLARI